MGIINFRKEQKMQRMLVAAAAAATVNAQVSVEVPDSMNLDKGYLAGLKEGLFLPIEEHALRVTECKRPGLPRPLRSEYISKALSFWPMVKSMIATQYGGEEPKWLSTVEDIFERFVILVSIGFGHYRESAYCYGAVNMYEVKAILLDVYKTLLSFLPEGVIPDFSQLPIVKMGLEMMKEYSAKMPEMPELPTKEDFHPKLQAAYDSLF